MPGFIHGPIAMLMALMSCACLLAGPVVAATGPENELSPEAAKALVTEFVNSVSSYQATFTQALVDESGSVQDEESGRMWLQRPGRFRWEYLEPWERIIVADGEKIWMYDSELDQVTVQAAAEALLQSPAALLVGELQALDDYLYSGAKDTEGATLVTVEPINARGDFEYIGLGFMDDGLRELVLQDRFGQRTVVTLTNIVSNPSLDPSLFTFELPEGADVIDQTAE